MFLPFFRYWVLSATAFLMRMKILIMSESILNFMGMSLKLQKTPILPQSQLMKTLFLYQIWKKRSKITDVSSSPSVTLINFKFGLIIFQYKIPYFEVEFDDEEKFPLPSNEELNRIFTTHSVPLLDLDLELFHSRRNWVVIRNLKTVSDNSTCQDLMQWTSWNSASDANTGSDFEILADHIMLFGWVEFLVVRPIENWKYRVCSSPSHIEARTVIEKLSWLGTDAALIYDTTPKPAAERNWAYGISRDFG